MNDYYAEKLNAQRLVRCYEIAPPRVQQYLKAELEYVLDSFQSGETVLELGCGYGRILAPLASKSGMVTGVDTSHASLLLAREKLKHFPNCFLVSMNAVQLAFPDQSFDCVVCIQNGISAFHVNQQTLIKESLRVTKVGGRAIFSSYSDKFWEHRLEWFHLQSQAGLLGEIDQEKTGDGIITCKDGFTGTTVRPYQFQSLT